MTTLQAQAPQAVPKRPRLALKINTHELSSSSTVRTTGLNLSPTNSTALNTLSNKYALALDRPTPTQSEPLTAHPDLQSYSCSTPIIERRGSKPGARTTFSPSFPETPGCSSSSSPHHHLGLSLHGHSTATPPLSAGAVENGAKGSSIFLFPPPPSSSSSPRSQAPALSLAEPRLHRRHLSMREAGSGASAPYDHPRSLHSILRNSPLPPRTATPASPRRQPFRLKQQQQHKMAKKVGYNNPLTQDIVTEQYVKSHIDLLMEEASPATPRPPLELEIPDQAFNTEDVGLTPGVRVTHDSAAGGRTTEGPDQPSSHSASASTSSPPRALEIGGICKRKKEKKRRWVWTIGVKDEEEDADADEVGGAIAALRAERAASTRGGGDGGRAENSGAETQSDTDMSDL